MGEEMEELNLDKLMKVGRNSDEIVVNEFTEDSAQKFRDEVLEEAKGDPKKPILIYIDSYGGYLDSLAKMIETMDEIPNPIITVTLGKAMSCGAVLLSHGDFRFCGRHSRIMIHEASGGGVGDVHDASNDVQELKRQNKYFMNLLAKNCGIKGGYDAFRKLIKDQDGRDRYMNADEAVAFGIVDGIGTPKVNRINVYQVELVPAKPSLHSPKSKKKVKKSKP